MGGGGLIATSTFEHRFHGKQSTRRVGDAWKSRDEKKQGKLVQNPNRTGFIEAHFASRQKWEFGLCENKIRNWYKNSNFE